MLRCLQIGCCSDNISLPEHESETTSWRISGKRSQKSHSDSEARELLWSLSRTFAYSGSRDAKRLHRFSSLRIFRRRRKQKIQLNTVNFLKGEDCVKYKYYQFFKVYFLCLNVLKSKYFLFLIKVFD